MIWWVRAAFGLAIVALLVLAARSYLGALPGPVVPATDASVGSNAVVSAMASTPPTVPTAVPRPTSTSQTIISRMARITPTVLPQPAAAPNAPLVVTISDAGFAPAELNVKVGARVSWKNIGAQSHDVSMLSQDRAVWGSGLLAPDAGASRAFDAPGQYDYTCSLHTVMRGRIVVER